MEKHKKSDFFSYVLCLCLNWIFSVLSDTKDDDSEADVKNEVKDADNDVPEGWPMISLNYDGCDEE